MAKTFNSGKDIIRLLFKKDVKGAAQELLVAEETTPQEVKTGIKTLQEVLDEVAAKGGNLG